MKASLHIEGIIQNLKDANCDEATIEAFICNLQMGRQANAVEILQKHRRCLLDCLHKYQKRIDCLDYLVFMLQRKKKG